MTGTIPELLEQLAKLPDFEQRSLPSFEKQLKGMKPERENLVFGFQRSPLSVVTVKVNILP